MNHHGSITKEYCVPYLPGLRLHCLPHLEIPIQYEELR